MLDIKFIRENKDFITAAAKMKRLSFDVEELLKLDDERRALLAVVEQKRAEHNVKSDQMVRTSIPERRQLLLDELRAQKAGLEEEETKLKKIMQQWQALMLQVPNVPDISVPEGASEADNKEVKIWGSIPEFTFPAKGHMELMEAADMVDFVRGGDVSGFRGYFLKNDGALLLFALWQFTLEHFAKKGFMLMAVPSLVRKQTLLGTGYLPQGEDDLYKTQDGDYLSGTAEELLQALNLPYRVVVNCGGDLGLGQVKKYDIETWVPSEKAYRETHSSSYFHDFQTRRLNIRYKDESGKSRFAHSLNNTAIATPRILVPLVEHNQQADGFIKVPEALQKYAGKEIIAPVR